MAICRLVRVGVMHRSSFGKPMDEYMRILIQQKETGLYFKDVDAWTRNPAEAMDFLSSTSAIDFCVMNKISGVQLVLKFEEQRYDIVLPVLTQKTSSDESRKPA
jgi:hypothetical protein